MSDLDICLTLCRCENLDLQNLKEISAALFDQGLIFQRRIEGKNLPVRTKSEIDDLVDEYYQVDKYHAETGKHIEWSLLMPGFPANYPDIHNNLITMYITQFYTHTNRFRIGGLLNLDSPSDLKKIEEFTTFLVKISKALYPICKPFIGWIDNTNRNTMNEKDAAKLMLRTVGWINLWGADYVDKYGEKFFLGMPGCKTERLVDGGVNHQLSSSLVTEDRAAAKVLRGQVVDYCAEHDFKVRCYAPYTLPSNILANEV